MPTPLICDGRHGIAREQLVPPAATQTPALVAT